MFKTTAFAAAFALAAGAALAEPQEYAFDSSHSQIVFEYNHLGFSTTTGMFSGITGKIAFDADQPANSSVEATFPLASLMTGDEGRDKHFLTADFFGSDAAAPEVTFVSTSIEVTGDNTALITGDLTLNGVTKPVVIAAKFIGEGKDPWGGYRAGFEGTTTIKMKDFGIKMDLGPASENIELVFSIEGIRQ